MRNRKADIKIVLCFAAITCMMLFSACTRAEVITQQVVRNTPTESYTPTPTVRLEDASLNGATEAPQGTRPVKTPTINATITKTSGITPTPAIQYIHDFVDLPWAIAYSNHARVKILSKEEDVSIELHLDPENRPGFVYSDPAWSPDGKYVAYSMGAAGNPERIAIRNLDNEQDEDVSLGWNPTWSPDGSKLILSSKDGDLVSYDVKAKHFTHITYTPHTIELSPAWSWDGRWLAFLSFEPGDSENAEIKLLDPINNTIKTIHMDRTPGNGKIAWSPDHTKIAFRSIDGCGVICTVDIHSEKTTCHPTTFAGERDPSWSPDGQWIMFSATDTSEYCNQRTIETLSLPWKLYLMKPDGSDVHPLILNDTGDRYVNAAWSPITPITLQTRFRVTPLGDHLNLRETHSTDARILKQYTVGDIITPIEGPVFDGTQTWWKIREEGTDIEGWVAEGAGWLQPAVP